MQRNFSRNAGLYPSDISSRADYDSVESANLLETQATKQRVDQTLADWNQRQKSYGRARNLSLLMAAIILPAAVAFPGAIAIGAVAGFMALASGITLYRRAESKRINLLGKWSKELTVQLAQQRFLAKGHNATRALVNGGMKNILNRPDQSSLDQSDPDRDQDGGSRVSAPNRPKGPVRPPLVARAHVR